MKETIKYFRQFKGEKEITEISKEEMIKRVGQYYKNPEDIINSVPPVPSEQDDLNGHLINVMFAYYWRKLN